MTQPLLMEIGDRIQRAENTAAARDFAETARILALAKGSISEARRLAFELSSPRVVAIFERAEPGSALGGTSPSWGDALSDYQQTAEGFIASLRNDGCFDAVLPYTARLPFRTKLAVSVTGNRDNRSRRKACLRSRFHCHGTRAVLKCGHGHEESADRSRRP
jgi:hypothetical protein